MVCHMIRVQNSEQPILRYLATEGAGLARGLENIFCSRGEESLVFLALVVNHEASLGP